jgi:hypothetical protein
MSWASFESPATRLDAELSNAISRPSAEMQPLRLISSPSAPAESTLIRSVVPDRRWRTNTSANPFASPGTRLEA